MLICRQHAIESLCPFIMSLSIQLSFFMHRGIYNVNIPQINNHRLMTNNVRVIFFHAAGNLMLSVLWRELSLITYLLLRFTLLSFKMECQMPLSYRFFFSHVLLFYLHYFSLSYTQKNSSTNMRFIASH